VSDTIYNYEYLILKYNTTFVCFLGPHTFYYMELALEGKLTRKLNLFKVNKIFGFF